MNIMERPTAALGLSPPQPAEHSAEQFEQFHQPTLEQPGQQFQQYQQPAPAMQVIHPASPALQPALGRSVRPTKGQTDRYKDFVQHIGPYQQNYLSHTSNTLPIPGCLITMNPASPRSPICPNSETQLSKQSIRSNASNQ